MSLPKKHNKVFLLVIIISLTGLATLSLGISPNNSAYEKFKNSKNYEELIQCPDDHPKAKEVLELFLTSSDYHDVRVREGVDGLTTSQIRVLTDSSSSDVQICEELNTDYSTSDNPVRLTVYYQVGDYYFVLRPLIQTPESNYFIMGPHFLTILDSNMNKVAKISM